jgi:hypothetical protein
MSSITMSKVEEDELIHLWAHRSTIDKAEWERLWKLSMSAVMRCSPSMLRSLPDTKQNYANDWFVKKVLFTKDNVTTISSARVLATSFNHHLIDLYRQLDEHKNKKNTETKTNSSVDDHHADPVGRIAFQNRGSRISDAEQVASNDVNESCDCGKSGADLDSLSPRLLESAELFFKSLSREEQIYLALHTCDAEGEALYNLADRLNIASYHYKAGKLGITRKKGELHIGYEKTRIGAWLSNSLGILISPVNAGQILEAFTALCQSAFMYLSDLSLRSES